MSPTFTVDRAGNYVAQLIVNDGTVNSAPDTVIITSVNVAPVANAGPDQAGKAPGALITLNGSASSDANGDPLTYSWSLTSAGRQRRGPASPTSVSPTFTVDLAGNYVAQLIVNDGTVRQRTRQRDHHRHQCRPVAGPGPAHHPEWQLQLRCQRRSAHLSLVTPKQANRQRRGPVESHKRVADLQGAGLW